MIPSRLISATSRSTVSNVVPEASATRLRMRVANAAVSLRFFRKNGRSDYEVLDKQGTLFVVRQPSPWSLTAGFAERLPGAYKFIVI